MLYLDLLIYEYGSGVCLRKLKAIRLVLKDDGFNVPSQSARNATESLLELSGKQENKESLSHFATYLLTELGKCFSVCNTQERMA